MRTEQNGNGFPEKCVQMDENGNLPTCTQQSDGTWEVDYPGGFSSGVGSSLAALFVIVLLLSVAGMVWKVSTARRMARDSGMSTGDATGMALLTDDGFEATYLASNLRGQTAVPAPAAPSAPSRGSAADRLAELQTLREQGLVTDEEYAAARQKILDDL